LPLSPTMFDRACWRRAPKTLFSSKASPRQHAEQRLVHGVGIHTRLIRQCKTYSACFPAPTQAPEALLNSETSRRQGVELRLARATESVAPVATACAALLGRCLSGELAELFRF